MKRNDYFTWSKKHIYKSKKKALTFNGKPHPKTNAPKNKANPKAKKSPVLPYQKLI